MFMGLSNSWAFDPVASCGNPKALDTSVSYYSESSSKYILATDTCMQAAFEALGMVKKAKPQSEQYLNEYFSGIDFADGTLIFSKQLNMIGTVSQFKWEGKFLTETLGFKFLPLEENVPGAQRDELLNVRFLICEMSGNPEEPVYKSCALLPSRIRAMFGF
jgi:hypothetical protein